MTQKMYINPKISMCLSIDGNNAIAYDGKPINAFAPEELKRMDYGVLTNYLRWVREVRGYLVIGEKTLEDMRGIPAFDAVMNSIDIAVITVGHSGVRMMTSDLELVGPNPTSESLFNKVMTRGIQQRVSWIHVLGGARVYDAFIQNIDEMVVGLYDEPLSGSKDRRVISEPHLAQFLREKPVHLLTTSEGVTYSLYHVKFTGA